MSNKNLETNEDEFNMDIRYDHIYKIITIGDSGVGKTSLISKYVKGVFPRTTFPTIAIEFATKIIQIKDGGYIKAQIWDTAGQEKYKSITNFHYRKAVGGLIVYDITKRASFENAKQWHKDLVYSAESSCISALVGNKVDLVEKHNNLREVSYEEGKQFAEDNNMLFYETSAQIGNKVNDVFEDLLQTIYTERRKIPLRKKNSEQRNNNMLKNSMIIKNQQKNCCG